jgi:hypothetical protein
MISLGYEAGYQRGTQGLRLLTPTQFKDGSWNDFGMTEYIDGYFDAVDDFAGTFNLTFPPHYEFGRTADGAARTLKQGDYICGIRLDFPDEYLDALGLNWRSEALIEGGSIYVYDPFDIYPLSCGRYQYDGLGPAWRTWRLKTHGF